MRLLCTIPESSAENPLAFSYYLRSQGIENTCEEVEEGGKTQSRIWVHEEDSVEQAEKLYREYQAHPSDAKYRTRYDARPAAEEEEELADEPPERTSPRRRSLLSQAPYGPVTVFILLAVITIFVWSSLQRDNLTPPSIPGVIMAPTLSPIDQALLIDYPVYFQLRDKLLKIYTPEEIKEQTPPSSEARKVMQEIRQTPVWMGFYDRFLDHFKKPEVPLSYSGPILEKVSQGQAWRLFSPALLHLDLLHIFFNVLWFILLGNQIEYRLGSFRYILLILATALASNVAQYFMSGPFFMGLSGVVVGLAAFIWARQQVAPWEGYLLQRFTLIFLTIFVLGMFALQLVFFVLQIVGPFQTSFSIANTAHLTGGLVGYLLGRSRFFAIKHKLR